MTTVLTRNRKFEYLVRLFSKNTFRALPMSTVLISCATRVSATILYWRLYIAKKCFIQYFWIVTVILCTVSAKRWFLFIIINISYQWTIGIILCCLVWVFIDYVSWHVSHSGKILLENNHWWILLFYMTEKYKLNYLIWYKSLS